MFDAKLRPIIDPPLNRVGAILAGWGVSANGVTMIGLAAGLAGAVAVTQHAFGLALLLILSGRILDGLDGAVARATEPSDFGGYLDIVADFAFYVAVPLAFGFADRDNLPSAMLLIAAFTLTGISFLAFAVIAAKRGIETAAHGRKSFFYSTGLAEGTETIVAIALMCLFPAYFPLIALGYALLCLATVVQRTWAAHAAFG